MRACKSLYILLLLQLQFLAHTRLGYLVLYNMIDNDVDDRL